MIMMNDGVCRTTYDDEGGLVEEEHLKLAKEVKEKKVEQERLQNLLFRKPQRLIEPKFLNTFSIEKDLKDIPLTEGELFKKEGKTSNWGKYWFRLSPVEQCLNYWKSKQDADSKKFPGSKINISWFCAERTMEEDFFALKQQSFFRKAEICTYRVSVYSPNNRTYILTATNDQELNKWITNISRSLEIILLPEEYKTKMDAAIKLAPLQSKQLKMEKEQYKLIVQSLQTSGIYPGRPTGKRREGYLDMQKADGSWKRYYFVLFKESLSYFNLDDKVVVYYYRLILKFFNI